MRYIDQIDVTGKKVLVRVDYNVPLDGDRITDDNRIRESLPTIRYLLEKNAAIILCCHLGKPKGKPDPAFSVKPLAGHLSQLLSLPVLLAPDCVGPEVEPLAEMLKPGQILFLENLRFHPEEEGKTPADRGDFGARLAALADVYVFDAFGVAHRPNASVTDIPAAAKVCCMGFLMKKEWKYLGEALSNPARPFAAVSGGAKVSSKLAVLTNLLGKVDDLIIGGAMANTFLLAKGKKVGISKVEADLVDKAKEIMALAAQKGTTLHLPTDFVVGLTPKDAVPLGVFGEDHIPDEGMILDIGPDTLQAFKAVVMKAKTIVWNGPMGLFENPAFAMGTLGLAKAMVESPGTAMAGGGDTDAVLHQAGLAGKFDFISTGGGSFLEFLEGRELPGFTALKECDKK